MSISPRLLAGAPEKGSRSLRSLATSTMSAALRACGSGDGGCSALCASACTSASSESCSAADSMCSSGARTCTIDGVVAAGSSRTVSSEGGSAAANCPCCCCCCCCCCQASAASSAGCSPLLSSGAATGGKSVECASPPTRPVSYISVPVSAPTQRRAASCISSNRLSCSSPCGPPAPPSAPSTLAPSPSSVAATPASVPYPPAPPRTDMDGRRWCGSRGPLSSSAAPPACVLRLPSRRRPKAWTGIVTLCEENDSGWKDGSGVIAGGAKAP